MDVETALIKLGKWNRWQLVALVLLPLSFNGVLALNMMIFVFTGFVPDHKCKLPQNRNTSEHNGPQSLDKCLTFQNGTNVTQLCNNGWTYNLDHGPTIVSEWDLVCSQDYLAELSQTLFMVGLGVSNIYITALADQFGRMKVHIIFAVLAGIAGIITTFSPNYTAFIILRFLQGLFTDGVYGTGQIWLAEHFPADTRPLATSIGIFFWSPAVWTVTLAAYLIKEWRYVQLCIGLICLIPFCYIWILDESVPWLVASGKTSEAEAVLSRAARRSGLDPQKWNLERQQKATDNNHRINVSAHNEVSHKDTKYTAISDTNPDDKDINIKLKDDNIVDVMRHKRLCVYSLLLALVWFVNNLAYYGIIFNVGSLAGNLYINVLIIGVTEIVACIFILLFSKWWGRLPTMIGGLLVVGICLLLSVFIPNQTANGTDLSMLTVTVIMIGLTGTTASFDSACIYTPEVYPTHIRNLTYGFAMLFGRIGGIIAPFFSYVARITYWLPAVILAGISIFIGIACFILPETKSRPLFQTIADMNEWNLAKKKKAKVAEAYNGNNFLDKDINHKYQDIENQTSL